MGTLRDELLRQGVDQMDVSDMKTSAGTATSASQESDGTDTSVPESGHYTESIEDALARILQACDSLPRQVVDEELEAAIARREKGRKQFALLFVKRDELQEAIKDAEQKLARAKTYKLNDFVSMYSRSLEQSSEALALCERGIAQMGKEYPEALAELNEDLNARRVAEEILAVLVMSVDGRYTASGTPQPSSAQARDWFEDRMKEAVGAKVVCAPIADDKAVLQSATGDWAPRLAIAEAVEAYAALLAYQRAIQKTDRAKDQDLINGMIKAGYLIPPDEVDRQKKASNVRNILDLLEQKDGYCFIWVYSNRSTRIAPYASLRHLEAKIEYVSGKEMKHGIRIAAVTAPQLVEEFFKKGTQTFTFDDLREFTKREKVSVVIQTAVDRAVRYAHHWREEDAQITSIRNTADCELADFADNKPGIAVVFLPGKICAQLVSDGTQVTIGKMTSRSQDHWLYKAIGQGVPVKTFFARNSKTEEFYNARLQELAAQNEISEMLQLSLAAERLGAERILAASNNVVKLVMPASQGGCDGQYIVAAMLFGRTNLKTGAKTETDRQVSYVVQRTGDMIEFYDALSRFSRFKLETSGLELHRPYALVGGLNSYGLFVFRAAYCAVTKTPRDKAPEHLRDGFKVPEETTPPQLF